MTRPVLLTIDLEGSFAPQFRQISGEIVSEGKAPNGEEYIIFSDFVDTEKQRKIPKHRIKKISDVENTT